MGSNSLHLRVLDVTQRPAAVGILRELLGGSVIEDQDPSAITARLDNPAQATPVLPALDAAGISIASFALGQPSLDEVFLALTGHEAGSGVDTERTPDLSGSDREVAS